MAIRARQILQLAGCILVLSACGQRPAPAPNRFIVTTVAEKTAAHLPPGPLFWRVERFHRVEDAESAAGPTSLIAEVSGEAWLFTLGPAASSAPGGRVLAEIGPIPIAPAPEYLLRINRAGGPPGAATPVHSHPGSEAFYVLAGQLSQRTLHGVTRLDAGQFMSGHEPGMAMQLTSSGVTDLDQLVMFVVDTAKPFSSPAEFD